ncbi:uncharacterized protein LOC115775675 [Archocentrus centrarchus]|uniref:uncharacterized protein LOC115775675 n=1 Tax=Archocentrus centrarchus TaxID=63155 RepID=UPI0011EA3F2B|nr:uncharacterized protein LOC115775675 [Archocentrus centrarchus]
MKSWLPFLLLAHVSQHASGVEVYEGEEFALLPCKVAVNVSSGATAVVWDRDEFKTPTVHMRLQSGDDLNDQNERYKDRTSMRADALQTGELSLTLRNPAVSDSGTYTCTTRKYGQDQSQTAVQLKVKELPPVWPKVLSAVLIILILLIAVVFGVLKYRSYKRKKRGEALQVEMVEATEWEKSILLPFKTTVCLPDDVTVEWKHKDTTIVKCQSSQRQALLQGQGYEHRAEMNEEPLKTGDLSLMLKDLQLSDHGVYICSIYDKSGKILRKKVVTLSVRDRQVEMVEVAEWEKNVKLPFATTADLPEDVTVEWRCSDSKQMMVYMYPSDQNQENHQGQVYKGRTEMNEEPLRAKDLSLTLKDLQLSDRGVYTCTVYNKGGKVLLQKVVSLSVRVSQLQVVVLTEGEESVLLPFKITDDFPEDIEVEWRHQNVKIYVYLSGQNNPPLPDSDYQGRTEMKEEEVKNGDLSLILKQPKLSDCGVYTCTIKDKDGKILRDKIVALGVQGSLKRGGTDLDHIMRHIVSSSPQASSTDNNEDGPAA